MAKRSRTPSTSTKKNITLEDYHCVLDNPCSKEDMKTNHLNQVQIIQMHGFIKLHRRPKTEVSNGVSTIDLMKLQRSTLGGDTICPYGSSLTIDQVNEDLDALEWQECPVQLVETVTDGGDCFRQLPVEFKIIGKKPRTKRGRRGSSKGKEKITGGDDDDLDHIFGDLPPLWY